MSVRVLERLLAISPPSFSPAGPGLSCPARQHTPRADQEGRVDPSSPNASTAASFQSTLWAMVVSAAGHDRTALEALLRAYWAPVYAAVRRKGYSGHDAGELTQEFMTQVVLGRRLAAKADPAKGRFRSFLKQALRNFLIDQHRSRRRTAGPAAHAHASLDHAGPNLVATSDDAAQRVFDRQWAAAIVEQTLDRLEADCLAEGLEAHWAAFNLNVLGPALRSTAALPLAELARRVGAADAAQAGNMLQTVKRRFRRTLRDVVAQTVADPAHVDAELDELRQYLAPPQPASPAASPNAPERS
jgi:RNA polymerase sigma-70 factor (ECF subfamily)